MVILDLKKAASSIELMFFVCKIIINIICFKSFFFQLQKNILNLNKKLPLLCVTFLTGTFLAYIRFTDISIHWNIRIYLSILLVEATTINKNNLNLISSKFIYVIHKPENIFSCYCCFLLYIYSFFFILIYQLFFYNLKVWIKKFGFKLGAYILENLSIKNK